jgi:hypothetical protein
VASGWSRVEVEATVADYLSMLTAELKGEEFNKAEHNRRLRQLLSDRTKGAVELKHQNISAIMIELGLPYVDGYKPMGNYQALLFDVVSDRVRGERPFLALVEHSVTTPASSTTVRDILSALEDPPKPAESKPYAKSLKERPVQLAIDYLAREASNASLGAAGETFVIEFERERLKRAGKGSLADRLERVSETKGPWAGYDIRSFETDGTDRFIEAKTTAYGKETPFYVTRNEVQTSIQHDQRYHLYRVFKFRKEPRLFALNGSLDRVCRLDPVNFMARVG